MSVAEGSRVYVDNISFTNTFSNVIGDNNDQIFLKTATNTAKVTPADRTYNWSYTGFPTDRLLSGTYDLKVKGFTVDLTATTFNHGTFGLVTFTPVAAVPGEYTFVISNVTYGLFIYDVTQTSFAINSNYPSAGKTGHFSDGALVIDGQFFNAADRTLMIVPDANRSPVRNLMGT